MHTLFENKKRNRTAALSSLAFMLIAHLYCWTNEMYNHDSLLVWQANHKWQISLGRILHPVYLRVRGQIAAPFIIALFGGTFLVCAVILCVHLLDLKKTSSVVLCAGLLVTFETIAYLNATYIFCFDLDMLALLLSVSAVFLLRTETSFLRWPAAVLCCVATLCLYQSYLQVTVTLMLLLLLKDLLEDRKPKQILFSGLSSLAVLLCSGILYYAALRLTWHFTGIRPTVSYNSLAALSALSGSGLLKSLPQAWFHPFRYFGHSEIAHRSVSALIYLVLFLLFAGMLLFLFFRKKRKPASVLLLLLVLLLLPLGMSFVYVLSNGLLYTLMIYSYALFPCAVLMLYDRTELPARARALRTLWRFSIPVLCGTLVLNHVLFSNQLYLKEHLEAKAALSFMTRVTERMEETEGYRAGETRVVILGHVDESPVSMERPGFDISEDNMAGTLHHLSISYYRTYSDYFTYQLGYPIRLVPLEDLKPYIEDPRIQSMPVYPEEGSVQMIGDTLVIRLSEDLRPEEMRG